MATNDDFEDWDTLSDYLGDQLNGNRIALILGAGISKPLGLPKWDELMTRLYSAKGGIPPANDPKRQAEYFRTKFFKGDPQGFKLAVSKALYEDVDDSYETLRRCDTLAAIASLAMSSKRGSASQVITFNWDDLLETYLEYHGFVTSSILHDIHWATVSDTTIFHPHGFLPKNSKRKSTDNIVFDQWSYTSIMGNDGRIWRESLTAIMRTRTCLFIGLSGNDDNLDLLLHDCMNFHASNTESTANWGVVFTSTTDETELEFWKMRHVHPVVVKDFDRDLPQKLFCIPQSAAKIATR
jgi:hypothetical protein